LISGRRLTVWWDALPPALQQTTVPTGQESNIAPADYVGPESCKDCHARNYQSWLDHPHRRMNALAGPATIQGDFSGQTPMLYRGGKATFYRNADGYFMRLERDGVRRLYTITQTIGSRFFQRYVGKQLEGPEPPSHHFYHKDHVLPLGYWLEQREWVPIIHVGPEKADDERPDPYDPPDHGIYYAEYAVGCNSCHTTFPLADMFGRRAVLIGEHAPVQLHWSMRKYLDQAHPEVLDSITATIEHRQGGNPMLDWEASRYGVTLGISCEACHLGARAHVASRGRILPKFFPSSPQLFVDASGAPRNFGRTHDNVNWACGRCHTGKRPQFAAGMSTWNSVEYADAMRGSCYSKLRCIDCHNPHRATGPRWSLSADQDDVLCLKCHAQLEAAPARLQHTHHPAGSEGARCMNCHMPRINEGLRDVVRTHMIYSPTRADMIEANHPNACNLCHTDRPIDWTLRYLKEWYGKSYDDGQIAAHYPHCDQPVGRGWMESANPAVRLVAVEAAIRGRTFQELPQLLNALDDPYLVNRQFAYKGLQELLGVRFRDFGYRFYMTKRERRQPVAELHNRFDHAAKPR
jgi:predicted CXXCH cytochrome family protein